MFTHLAAKQDERFTISYFREKLNKRLFFFLRHCDFQEVDFHPDSGSRQASNYEAKIICNLQNIRYE